MNYADWNYAYTKITNKLNKNSPLSVKEIDELLEIIEKVKKFIAKAEYEVLKRQ